MLWLRNNICEIFEMESRLLLSLTTWPALENILSQGTDVAIIHSLLLTSVYNLGYTFLRSAHQTKGFSARLINGSFKYLSTSIVPATDELDPPIKFTTVSSNSFHSAELELLVEVVVAIC